MKRIVVDASVVAAAFFQEEHSPTAWKLLRSSSELHAPDLLIAELANVLWKRTRRDEITPDEAAGLLDDFLALPLRLTQSADIADAALSLAITSGRTVHDCLYVAVAVAHDSIMFTADQRLANAMSSTPLASRISWIGTQSA